MPYIPSQNREQLMLCSLDSFVAPDSIARIIDAFVQHLDITALGFAKSTAAYEGRPSYDPRSLLALYIYGSRKSIRSSRKLAEACRINIEVKWLMGGLEPDFRTISDFRKDNISHLKDVFHEFNRRLASADIPVGFISVDGSKFQAWNAKDANFTANKLDDRITWLNQRTDEYLRTLENMDDMDEEPANGQLTRDEVLLKLDEAEKRLEKYKFYRQYMEETGLAQLSITDADSRLMKSKNGFIVAYNVQTAVDSESHIIRDFQVTNQVTDHGLLNATASPLRADGEILDAVADKGYNQSDDMIACLENGVVPHVILPDGQSSYELELPFETAQDVDVSSNKPEDLRKALRAGKIPDAYKDVITKIEVLDTKRWIRDSSSPETPASPYGSTEDMKQRAASGYFVRDPERNVVYCPMQEVLHQKCIKKNGVIRYANRAACKRCPNRNRCLSGKLEWKEVDFTKDSLEKPCRKWCSDSASSVKVYKPRKGRFEPMQIVRFIFTPKPALMQKRLCISEHPFGTLKRSMDAGYFLLRSKLKVAGEFALFSIGYNIQRAVNLLGFERVMAAVSC